MAQNLTFNLNVDSGSAVASINEFFNTFDQGAARASNKLRNAFNEPIKTEVEISLKNGELVAKKIESTKNKSKQLKDVFRALNGEIGKTPNELKKQLSVLKALQGNTAKYEKGTNRVAKEWKLVEDRIRKVKIEQDKLTGGSGGGGMDNFIGKFALVQTAANLATSAIMGIGRQVQELGATGARMEVLMLQLEAFTGSAAEADRAYEAFAETARGTPFNVEEVAQAGKIMMAFGVETDVAVEMTDRLGIVAAATGGDINNLGRNLGQIAAQGQAYTRDLHQFAMQGLPIWDEMSKVTGKTVVELKSMASEGQISFEIVSAAIKNMSAEGSAFNEVSTRMSETFTGRMAQIETALVKLSKGMIDAFNEMDRATGKVMSGAMLEFAKFLEGLTKKLPEIGYAAGKTLAQIGSIFSFISNVFSAIGGFIQPVMLFIAKTALNVTGLTTAVGLLKGAFDTLLKPLGDAGFLLAALAGPAMVVGIGLVIKSIYGMMTATYAYIKAQIISLGLSGPVGWGILVGAAAATAGAYLMLKDNLSEANEEMAASNAAQDAASQKARELTGEQESLTVSVENTSDAFKSQAEAADIAAKKAKGVYEDAKKESDALKESILKRIEDEKLAVQALIETKKTAISDEKEAYRSIKETVKERYDDEKTRIEDIYDRKLRALDLERDSLGKRGPKEQELYELQKKELQAKLEGNKLDEKERLEIEARLERMGRQEQMEKLAAERKQVQLNKEMDIKKLEEERDRVLEEHEKKHKSKIELLEKQLEELENGKKKLEEQKRLTDETVKGVQAYNGELNAGISRLDTLVSRTATLKQEWEDLAAIAARAKLDAREARANTGTSSGGGSAPTTSNFAGGPISAGTKSWVNELGKEAFLSASGRLSMINDKNGQWTAPSDGTIIPAHLTSQLNVPTGGVNLNKGAASNASRAGASGMGAMVRAIRGSMSGDTFNQSVTVQSANPVQAASDMMVEMARMKRRKYR